jgi:hypothetical protein
MNQPETKILIEIKRIEQAASNTLQSASISDGGMNGEDLSEVSAWVTQLGQLVRSLYGERSEQYATFTRAIETQNFYSLHSNWNSHIAVLLGLAKAVTHDIKLGSNHSSCCSRSTKYSGNTAVCRLVRYSYYLKLFQRLGSRSKVSPMYLKTAV